MGCTRKKVHGSSRCHSTDGGTPSGNTPIGGDRLTGNGESTGLVFQNTYRALGSSFLSHAETFATK